MSLSAALLLAFVLGQVAPAAAPASDEPAPPPAADFETLRREVERVTRELEEQKQLLAMQLAEGEAAQSSASNVEAEQIVRLYGFSDVGLQRAIMGPRSALAAIQPSNATTFVLGNLNLYIDAQPGPRWSSLVELRFTTYPLGTNGVCGLDGTKNSTCATRTTEIFDVTSANGGWSKVRWGSIVLERAYLEHKVSDQLKLRAGIFLTPFGIWNIDHGTPTLISLALPQFETNEMFPPQQLGVEALGSWHLGAWELGYYLTISNGRPIAQVDYTDDKMLGARLFLRRSVPFRLQLGASGLHGRFVNQDRVIVSAIPHEIRRVTTVEYNETTGGADVSVDYGRLRIRSEFAISRVKFKEGKRSLYYGQNGVFTPDYLTWDVYALAAYRLPWWGLEPFVYFEMYRFPSFLSEGIVSPSVGLNIHFTPYAQLKTQYLQGRFINFGNPTTQSQRDHDFHLLMARLVLAF